MPRYQAYYARRPTFHPSGEFGTPRLMAAAVQSSHVHLCEVEGSSLDDAYWRMQGKNWSPHGEARKLLQALGLRHTSMSVGDLLRDEEGTYWECLDRGWRPLACDAQGDAAHVQG